MDTMKKKVAVLFGGVSNEHEISLVSAACFLENLPPEYEAVCLGITKQGRWLAYPGGVEDIRTGAWQDHPGCVPAFLCPDADVHGLLRWDGSAFVPQRVDLVLPALHGKNGEDGTLQGLLEMAGIPYVGCGVLASAACMDKVTANLLFAAAGVPHCRWDWMTTAQLGELDAIEARLAQTLGYPLFVKPANAGSSVGVSRVEDAAALAEAVRLAAVYDSRIVFEEAVVGHEVECAVLGNSLDGDLLASAPGEVVAANTFYDYDAKYLNSDSRTLIPAAITPAQQQRVRQLACRAYTALGCSGLARCDFFVRKDGEVLINEINTLPGFTPISMYPQLMAHEGLPCTELLRRLLQLAEVEGARRQLFRQRGVQR